jgi:hypothetical protein
MIDIDLIQDRLIVKDDKSNKTYDITNKVYDIICKKFTSKKSSNVIYDLSSNRYILSIVKDDYSVSNNELAKIMGLRIDKDEEGNFIYWNPSAIVSDETKDIIIDPIPTIKYSDLEKMDPLTRMAYEDCLIDWKPQEDWNQLIQVMKANGITAVYDFNIKKQYDAVLINLGIY